jgi:hypothetical protein
VTVPAAAPGPSKTEPPPASWSPPEGPPASRSSAEQPVAFNGRSEPSSSPLNQPARPDGPRSPAESVVTDMLASLFAPAPPPAPELRPERPPAVVFEPPPALHRNASTVPPAFSAPLTSPAPVFTAATWTVVVAADRGYYDRMKMVRGWSDSDAFPAQVSERRIPLAGKQMRIGRRNAARELEPEIDLADPPVDRGISRLHAILIATSDGSWSVLDPGSANGTLLNGRQIATGDLITLREGDRINLGAWTVITVHRG